MAEAAAAPASGGTGRHWPRPRLIDLYLVRGLVGPFLLILGAACVAMMLERALRLIQEMAAAGAHVSYFFPMLGQLLPYYLNLALPAAFMAALVLLISRLDERLELETLLASGLSLGRIAAPLVAAGLVVAAAGLAANGFLEPLGRYNYRSMRIAAVNAGRIRDLQPKAFYLPAEGVALTVDARSGGESKGLFLRQRSGPDRELVLTATAGRIGLTEGAREIDIRFGPGLYFLHRRESGAPRPLAVRHRGMAFRESLLVDDALWARGWDQAELTLTELAAERSSGTSRIAPRKLDAELYSRLARSLTIPLIPLLVLPLCVAAKRGRRGLGVTVAAAILLAFHHGLNFARNLGNDGSADPRLSVGLIVFLFAALVLAIFVSGRHLPSHGPILAARAWLHRRRRALPVRARPPLIRAGGRTIAFYVAWQFAKWSLAIAAAIALLLQMVDIFDRGDAFVERGMGPADMGRYALLRLPAILQQAIPIAALAGGMIAFLNLSRSREMVAIRSAGISQYRLLLMVLPAAALLSLAVYLLADRVAPRTEVALTSWWRSTAPPDEGKPAAGRWFRIGGELVEAASASPDGSRLEGLTIYRRDSDGLLTERLAAGSASFEQGAWTLHDMAGTRIGPGGAAPFEAKRLSWPTSLRAADVRSFFASSAYISSDSARRSLDSDAPVGQGDAFFQTRLQRMFAEPLAPILLLLLALPLAFSAQRTGPSWIALAYAAGGGLTYIVLDGVLTVTAQLGMIPPMIGAWTVPVLFGLIGLTVLLYSER
ncbi:MAG TPA: LptF/LptG family permease [Allosphingosinicella sp.]